VSQTALERQLAGERPEGVTPVDALKAARRHFLNKERVDMVELAGELGVGRATLYRWVGSREQLLGEVLWSMTEAGLDQARRQAKSKKGAEWVLAIYRIMGDQIVANDALHHFIETEPELALRVMTSKVSPQQRRMTEAWREILLEAERDKGLKLRLDVDTLAYVLVRIAESFLWSDLITGEQLDLAKANDVARALLT
jgi:AcrR family transcriptional regulator